MGTNSAGPQGCPRALTFASGSQECATCTQALTSLGIHQHASRTSFNLSELTQSTPSRGWPGHCDVSKDFLGAGVRGLCPPPAVNSRTCFASRSLVTKREEDGSACQKTFSCLSPYSPLMLQVLHFVGSQQRPPAMPNGGSWVGLSRGV